MHIQKKKKKWTPLFCFPLTKFYEDLWHSSGPSMKYPKEICFICRFNPINLFFHYSSFQTFIEKKNTEILLPHCTINLILNTNSNRIFISPLIFIFKTGSDQWLNSCNFVQGPAQTPVRHLVKDILKVQFSLWNRSLPGAVSQSRWRPGPFLVPFVNPLKEFVLLSCLKICMQLKFKAHNCILQSQFASVLICSLNACEIKI